jgi:hypothetical protein
MLKAELETVDLTIANRLPKSLFCFCRIVA